MQTDLLFPTYAVAASGPLPPGAKTIEVTTPDGESLRGVHMAPAQEADRPSTLILGFGGNAWNGQHVAAYLHDLFPEAHVIAFHYRGYRPSSGRPSAKALLEDAPRVFDEAVRRVRPERTVAVGFSIGTGVVARLARHRSVDGVILVTPFDSLKAVAQQLYPWLPVGLFFQHEFPAAADLAAVAAPVAVLAAERDEIIPPARTQALRNAVRTLRYDRTFARAGHNDIYHRQDFRAAMREALDAVAPE